MTRRKRILALILASLMLLSAAACSDSGTNEETDAAVSGSVVKGTAHRGAVGVIGRLSLGIVDQKSLLIAVKTAVDKHIVAAVVDTAVQAFAGHDVGEHMVLTEMGNVNTRAAV